MFLETENSLVGVKKGIAGGRGRQGKGQGKDKGKIV